MSVSENYADLFSVDRTIAEVFDECEAAFFAEHTQTESGLSAIRSKLPDPRQQSAYVCEQCEADIPQSRREALPGVKICIDCATSNEKTSKQYGAPHAY